MENDKRKRLRISFATKTMIIDPENRKNYEVAMSDISMNGMRGAISGIPMQNGQSCCVEIIIPGKTSRLILEVNGKIARKTDESIAVEFENDLEWWAIFSIYKPYGSKEGELPANQP